MDVTTEFSVDNCFREGPYEYIKVRMFITVEEDFPATMIMGNSPHKSLADMRNALKKKLGDLFSIQTEGPLVETVSD